MSVVRVCCAVIRRGDLYLVVQRAAHKSEALKWEFPGGKVEPGESDEACIAREIREELGLELQLHGRLRSSSLQGGSKTLVLVPFLATIASGVLTLHEHKDLRWVRAEELHRLDLSRADRDLIGILREAGLEDQGWWRCCESDSDRAPRAAL